MLSILKMLFQSKYQLMLKLNSFFSPIDVYAICYLFILLKTLENNEKGKDGPLNKDYFSDVCL